MFAIAKQKCHSIRKISSHGVNCFNIVIRSNLERLGGPASLSGAEHNVNTTYLDGEESVLTTSPFF